MKALPVERRTKMVQINQIVEEWRNENADTLDYKGYQSRSGNRDLNIDRNIQENILRVVSNKFY